MFGIVCSVNFFWVLVLYSCECLKVRVNTYFGWSRFATIIFFVSFILIQKVSFFLVSFVLIWKVSCICCKSQVLEHTQQFEKQQIKNLNSRFFFSSLCLMINLNSILFDLMTKIILLENFNLNYFLMQRFMVSYWWQNSSTYKCIGLGKMGNQNVQIMTWILNSVEPHFIIKLRPYNIAKDMWDYLKKIYHRTTQLEGFNWCLRWLNTHKKVYKLRNIFLDFRIYRLNIPILLMLIFLVQPSLLSKQCTRPTRDIKFWWRCDMILKPLVLIWSH